MPLTLRGPKSESSDPLFTSDGRFIVCTSADGSMRIWDATTGGQLCALYVFNKGDWAVVDPEGRFDGSPGGLKELHWVVGMTPIDLDQLKDRYYEPGLLAKVTGFNRAPLRDVSRFDHVALYPSIEFSNVDSATGGLTLNLANQGGGIGQVEVFVNGKELAADARSAEARADPNANTAALTVNIARAASITPGKPNSVTVVTRNAEGSIRSRSVALADYVPPGKPT